MKLFKKLLGRVSAFLQPARSLSPVTTIDPNPVVDAKLRTVMSLGKAAASVASAPVAAAPAVENPAKKTFAHLTGNFNSTVIEVAGKQFNIETLRKGPGYRRAQGNLCEAFMISVGNTNYVLWNNPDKAQRAVQNESRKNHFEVSTLTNHRLFLSEESFESEGFRAKSVGMVDFTKAQDPVQPETVVYEEYEPIVMSRNSVTLRRHRADKPTAANESMSLLALRA